MSRPRSSPIWQMSSDQLSQLVRESQTLTQILSHFGLRNIGGNNLTLKKRLAEEGIDYSHILLGRGIAFRKGGLGHIPQPKTLEECMRVVFVQQSNGAKTTVRRYLRQYKLVEEKCHECGLVDTWNGKSLTLQLEHKNGDSTDDRLDNLCWLCPNCHSQTSTYTGRNKRSCRII